MAKFTVKDTKELKSNADQFIRSIALAEDSKCTSKKEANKRLLNNHNGVEDLRCKYIF